MKSITLLTDISQGIPNSKNIGMLLEYAVDSIRLGERSNILPFEMLIGDISYTKARATLLAATIVYNEPYFRGVQQLKIFEEVIVSELCKIFHVIYLHQFLINHHFTHCEFPRYSWWAEELTKLVYFKNSTLKVAFQKNRNTHTIIRVFNKIKQANFTFQSFNSELNYLIDRIDPFHKRIIVKSNRRIKIHQPWFYTTARPFTHAGLLFESCMPSPFNFLVENKMTGGYPLLKKARKFTNLYRYGHYKFIPHNDEITACVLSIKKFLGKAIVKEDDEIALKMLLNSDWMTLFFTQLLPKGLYLCYLFENWINQVLPSTLFVGNTVHEGYALYKAKQKGIPTVLIQHDVIGENYSLGPVDYFFVKGEFWKNHVAEQYQKKTLILNPK